MKGMKITMSILLTIAVGLVAYLTIQSVVKPIRFEETRKSREQQVISKLIDLRTAFNEYYDVNGCYTDNLDTLVDFLKNTPMKEVRRDGNLSESQLKKYKTEEKAVEIINGAKERALKTNTFDSEDDLYAYIWANDPEILKDSLMNFRRDTIYNDMIKTLFEGRYTHENIEEIMYIPFSKNNEKFEIQTEDYYDSNGRKHALIQVSAHFRTYLSDLDEQELINLIDTEEQLQKNGEEEADPKASNKHYPGLIFGNISVPTGNTGNWE